MFQMLYSEIFLQLFHLLFFQLFLVFHAHILLYNFLFDLIFHLVVLNIAFFHLGALEHTFAFALKLQSFFLHLLEVSLVQISCLQIFCLYCHKLFVDNLLIVFLYFLYHNSLKIFQQPLYWYYFVKHLVLYLIVVLNCLEHIAHKTPLLLQYLIILLVFGFLQFQIVVIFHIFLHNFFLEVFLSIHFFLKL